MKRWMAAVGFGIVMVAAPVAHAQSTAWIHVQVDETDKPSKVNVNLPLALVEVVLQSSPEKVFSHGRVHLGRDGHDMSVADLRRIWRELEKAGDTELVSVEGEDETVKVARRGGSLQIRVQKQGSKTEEVNVDVPAAVLDALLSSEGEELNVRAALAQLAKLRGDLVRVHDGNSKVRIWIDEKS
jgi:hypothetical protein